MIIFCIGVLVNILGPKGIIDSYKRWGLPESFRFITATLEFLALILAFTPLQLLGYLIALTVMGGAILILLLNREYKPIFAPLVTCVIIIYLMI